MQDFDRWRQLMGRLPHTELAGIVLDESGYTGFWQQDKSPEAAGRLENLKELVAAMEEFENLGGFLEHVSLVTENETNAAGAQVTLMTLHAAKGLEFEHVSLPGRSEEHTSELQSLMRISYAVFCLKKKKYTMKIHI